MALLLPSIIITAYAISRKSWWIALIGAVLLLPVELYLAGTPLFSWALVIPVFHFAVALCVGLNKQSVAWVLLVLVAAMMVAIMYVSLLAALNHLMLPANQSKEEREAAIFR